MSDSELSCIMHERGIRPSLIRVAVLSWIANARKHSTADDIYMELSSLYPSLSRTSVYNSLKALVNVGIVKELEIECSVRHYDFALQPPHSHFVCKGCSRIFDMENPFDIKAVDTKEFEIEDVDIVFKGLCPECK